MSLFRKSRLSRRDVLKQTGMLSALGVPIVVDGATWGLVIALSTDGHPLPANAETRLSAFTELVATAIGNTQARDELRQLAQEQAALRRVATLVAQGTEAHEVFDAVCNETGQLIGASSVKQLEDNLASLNNLSFSEDELEKIESILKS